jgi:hypothetical protein
MFRLPVLVFLACAIAGASPLSWNWDIFQPANSLDSSLAYGASDAINSQANSDFTSVGDVGNWLPPAAEQSDPFTKSTGGDGNLRDENETVDGGLTQLDLSSLFGRPQIIGTYRVFALAPLPSV